MAMSIRSPEVEKLARDLSVRSGKTLTVEILEALRTRIKERDESELYLYRTLNDLATTCAELPDLDNRSSEDLIGYDDRGAFAHGR